MTPISANPTSATNTYDAILVVSFGGPEGPDDVIPFLENVLRGKPVPRERMLEVAEHYYHFGGVSPINAQVREFIASLTDELRRSQIDLPVYWGNRNWHPLLTDTIPQMQKDGVKRALSVMTSAYSCYSGCRQYRENVKAACVPLADEAPAFDKMRVFYNHPEFIAVNAELLSKAWASIPEDRREQARVAFTAHSIPMLMADHCQYERQLQETSRLVAEAVGLTADQYQLVYQSRSGRPQDPWLEPDVGDWVKTVHQAGAQAVVIAPIGFLSDHMEVMFDLDHEVKDLCEELNVWMARVQTVGTHPRFIAMIRELIEERMGLQHERRAIGLYGPNHDVCPENCCLYPIPKGGPPAGGGRPVAPTPA